tara:strand:- start:7 stop:342 length:336 start_codon:yes stop_codon:yes gene_type:complete
MSNLRSYFLVFLLALTVTLPSLMTHTTASAGAASDEMAGVHASSMCGQPSGMNGADDGCAAMAGHCLIASCASYKLSQPPAIRISISHLSLQTKSYKIFAAIETPPPRATS